jgi:hypothetical protein
MSSRGLVTGLIGGMLGSALASKMFKEKPNLKIDVSVKEIYPTVVDANSRAILYEDSGDLIFIYSPLGWNKEFVIQIVSDTASYGFTASTTYYSIISVITSGRTRIMVDNQDANPHTTNLIVVVKFNFRIE